MTAPYNQQMNGRPHVPIQSVSIDLAQDSLEYMEYSLDRFDKFINDYGPKAFYGGYKPKIIFAS